VLFGLNFWAYFWGNQKRAATLVGLQQAVARQLLLSSIKQDLHDLRKQVAQLSQVRIEIVPSGVGGDEIARLNGQFEAIAKDIRELRDLAPPPTRIQVEELEKTYEELTVAWRIFYENFGIDHVKALTELTTHADPLSEYVLYQMVPRLLEEERERVQAVGADLRQLRWLTDQTIFLLFALSILVAVVVAYRVVRHFATRLNLLKEGTALMIGGDLEHRLAMQSEDELSDLAKGLNAMTESLLLTRTQLTQINEELDRRHQEVEKERQVSDSLLLNILPAQVAEELKAKGSVEPKYFEDVTILFADFVGFTTFTEKLAAEDLVHMLHNYFSGFDEIMARYGLEKLKTIGDSYMCAGGLPARNPSHPVDALMAAFEIVRSISEHAGPDGQPLWAVRIGIHTGPVIAGMVGNRKFAYDIWGESVNYASRMESSSEPNRINLSGQTYSRVKDFFECEHRGQVLTKDKKKVDMYFAKGIWPNLIDDFKQIPPPAFLRRYRGYFQKDPPSFPAFLSRVVP
jgi:class 3 adenylate cyclase